jgi:dihydrofolate reductase
MKSMVVAYDLKRGIGAANDIMWMGELPADMKHFREHTLGKSIVMGRKTYESIGRPLPDRQNIVVTRSGAKIDGVTVVDSLPAAYAAADRDIAIIGGGEIFKQSLKDADVLYVTEVQAEFPSATVFFPELGSEWHEVSRVHHEPDERNKYPYDFVEYRSQSN